MLDARRQPRKVTEIEPHVALELSVFVGSFNLCRDAATTRSRRIARSPCVASNRSHSVISSLTLATMRLLAERRYRHRESAETLHTKTFSRHTYLNVVDPLLKNGRDSRQVYESPEFWHE
jgi:hypothetical protein